MQQDWQRLIDQTIQEKSLRDAYIWEPFAKGSSNSIFLGRLKHACNNNKNSAGLDTEQNIATESTVVLRVNAPAKDTPGVERHREAAILNWIEPYGWAPQIIRNEPELGWCLMHKYEVLKTDGNKLPMAHQRQLIKALDELQSIPVGPDTRNTSSKGNYPQDKTETLTLDYTALLNDIYLPMAKRRNDAVAKKWIQSVINDLSALPKLPSCLVHHDIHLGNLVLSKPQTTKLNGDLVILDWEYAAIGNPWFDASCLSRYLSIDNQNIFTLSIFRTLSKPAFESALNRANHMTEVLQELWYWAREE